MKITVASNENVYQSRKSDPWVFITNNRNLFPGNKTIEKPYLELSFMDLTPTECTGSFAQFKDQLCNEEDIKKIIDFVSLNKDSQHLWVSCDMGMCRSPAVANGIIKHLNLSQNLYIPPTYHPNPWVTLLFKIYLRKNSYEKLHGIH